MKQLILGGCRSGKSAYAESCAVASTKKLIYVATAQALDDEMRRRIRHHKSRREENWLLVEEPVRLSSILKQYDNPDHCILVDCLTLWLCNCLFAGDSSTWMSERSALIDLLPHLSASVLLVGNEVGSGVVPLGKVNRNFVDESGRLHQSLAALCSDVTYITAGLPQKLKSQSNSI